MINFQVLDKNHYYQVLILSFAHNKTIINIILYNYNYFCVQIFNQNFKYFKTNIFKRNLNHLFCCYFYYIYIILFIYNYFLFPFLNILINMQSFLVCNNSFFLYLLIEHIQSFLIILFLFILRSWIKFNYKINII